MRFASIAHAAIALVVAVAVTATATACGGDPSATAPSPRRPDAFPAPPPGAAVLAGAAGRLAVGLSIPRSTRSGRLQVSIVDQNGRGVRSEEVRLQLWSRGRTTPRSLVATPCGAGCYSARARLLRANRIVAAFRGRSGSSRVGFELPGRPLRPAAAIVARAALVFSSLRTLRFTDRLSAGTGVTVRSEWRIIAPDRVAYNVASGGAAVMIAGRRWDRMESGRWRSTTQPRLRQPRPFWASASNAFVVGEPRVRGRKSWRITFFDRSTPGWYDIVVDKATHRMLEMRMIAPAHFMRQTYRGFNAPLEIRPPSRR